MMSLRWKQTMAIAILGSLSVALPALATESKIALSPGMVTNEAVFGTGGRLVDEQAASGDPVNSSYNFFVPQTSWVESIPKNKWNNFPASAYIDLGQTYNLTNILLFSVTGAPGNVVVQTSTNSFQWTTAFTDPMTSNNGWNKHPVAIQARYVRFTVPTANWHLPEVMLYGTPVGTPAPTPTPVPHPLPSIDQFLGTNTLIDESIPAMAAVGIVREYHRPEWNETPGDSYPNNPLTFNPTWNGFSFDNWYSKVRGAGVTVVPCLQAGTKSTAGSYGDTLAHPVFPAGSDPALPASYKARADFMYQYVARYGSNSVPDANLKVKSGQQRISALHAATYFEDWNEQDPWWGNREKYFTPAEYTAMLSADYDGHLGALGSNVGIKNADPNAKVVMGGLATPSLDYLKGMKAWADANRGGSFPADVLNVHHYCNDVGNQTDSHYGISPEADNLKGRIQPLVQWTNQNLPGKEFWVSEFGWDVNPGSIQRAGAITGNGVTTDTVEVQADWLVRGFLALAAAGVDKAFMYELTDININDTTKYASSGLIQEDGTPRKSWYYVYTMKNRLKGMKFAGEINSGNSNVLIYRFTDANQSNYAYAVWCPTSNNVTVNNFSLPLVGNAQSATQIALTDGNTNGVASPLTIASGRVVVNVSEKPVFVMTTNSVPLPTSITITSPSNQAVYTSGSSFSVDATVANNTKPITKVDFYRNWSLVGTSTTAPYSLPQSGLAAGNYLYTAQSTDNTGGTAYTTNPVNVIIKNGTGLKAQYYNGQNFDTLVQTKVDPTINFSWAWLDPPIPSVNATHFSVRWTGKVQPTETGLHTFSVASDDGFRLWVSDGTVDRLVVDRWYDGYNVTNPMKGNIYLEAGKMYNFKAEYYQKDGGATAIVNWLRPGQTAFQVIPSSQLYPAP